MTEWVISSRHDQAHTPVALAQTGKLPSSNIALPQVLMASVIQRMPMMFMTIPVLACGRGGDTEQLVSLMNLKKKLEGLYLYKCTCSVRILM